MILLLGIVWLVLLLYGLRAELMEHRRLAKMASELREGRP
jgi:hypothetical protein